MKHKYLSLAVLSLFSGMTMAATSVTLYGTAEVAYQDNTKSGTSVYQGADGESRVGFKGQEDLGNGTAAFFQLESRYNLDTGANTGETGGTGFFDEKSIVGLSFANGAHKVYFGKSAAPIDRIGNDIGHLSTGQSVYYSMGGWRNGAFYDYSANGLAVNAAVTTKGGAYDPTSQVKEGVANSKASYGLSARYDASNWYLGAAWQADNNNLTVNDDEVKTGVKNEWLVTAGVKFNPVAVGASYSRAKGYEGMKGRKIQAHISGNVTPNDQLYATYV